MIAGMSTIIQLQMVILDRIDALTRLVLAQSKQATWRELETRTWNDLANRPWSNLP